ncbi:Methionine gamma-lyase-like protein [Drosera capensis]
MLHIIPLQNQSFPGLSSDHTIAQQPKMSIETDRSPLHLVGNQPGKITTNGCGAKDDDDDRHSKTSTEDPVVSLANARHEFGEHGGVNMSIEASATFTVMEPDTLRRICAGEVGPEDGFFSYSRHCNPTVLNLGRLMAALEGTEAAYCTASGMAAISSVLLQLVGVHGHVVASRSLYGGTHALLTQFLPRACGIETTFVDVRDIKAVKEAVVEGKTRVLYFESMSNPTLVVADVPELCRVAHEKGVTVVVDNTFAPMVLSPARLGADIVVHSISKYISGAADIIAER